MDRCQCPQPNTPSSSPSAPQRACNTWQATSWYWPRPPGLQGGNLDWQDPLSSPFSPRHPPVPVLWGITALRGAGWNLGWLSQELQAGDWGRVLSGLSWHCWLGGSWASLVLSGFVSPGWGSDHAAQEKQLPRAGLSPPCPPWLLLSQSFVRPGLGHSSFGVVLNSPCP